MSVFLIALPFALICVAAICIIMSRFIIGGLFTVSALVVASLVRYLAAEDLSDIYSLLAVLLFAGLFAAAVVRVFKINRHNKITKRVSM